MYRGMKVSVLVPAYQEEKLIARVIRGMPKFVDEIFVIDDCSTDGTYSEACKAADARTTVVRHETNQGVGGAILTGHQMAVEAGMDISAIMAGDDQMDPNELHKILDPIIDDNFGFVKANRFFSAVSFAGMPRHRVFGNVILTFLNKLATGYWHLFDPQNGFTATRVDVVSKMPLDRISRRYDFENDWLLWLSINDVEACDVSIAARYQDETSTIRLRETVPRMLRTLWLGFWRRVLIKYVLRSFSPIALLFLLGSLFVFFGVIGTAILTYQSVGGQSPSAATALMAVAPLLAGIQLLVQALVLDIQESPGYRR